MTHDPAEAGTPAASSGSPTRRRFIGLAAAAAAIPIAGCTTDAAKTPAKKASAKSSSPKPKVAENSLQGDPNWGISNVDKARLLYTSPSTRGHQQPAPAVAGGTNPVECNWEPSLTIPTDNWPEG